MNAFDLLILKTMDLLGNEKATNCRVNPKLAWPEAAKRQLILEGETGVELGESPLQSASYCLSTTNDEPVCVDSIRIIGDDISHLAPHNNSFGKIVLLQIKEPATEELYQQLKELEYVRYRLNLDGYMTRASSEQLVENVRISKAAIKSGISLERVGNSIINAYKKNQSVINVSVIFITKNIDAMKQLHLYALEAKKITNAMNTMLEGINLDCNSCNLSPVCDEVEGLRQLHKKIQNA